MSDREEQLMQLTARAKLISSSDVFEKLRLACLARSGYGGIRDIGRMFRIYDDDNSKTIDFEEFKKGVQDYGLRGLKEEDLKVRMNCSTKASGPRRLEFCLEIFIRRPKKKKQKAFDQCDVDHSGQIDFNELLKCMRAPMNERRIKIVEQAFHKMDNTGDNVITIDDLRKTYNARLHPKYLSGEMTEDEVLKQFLRRFEGDNGNRDDKVTLAEFLDYYNGVSANIDNDGYFDLMMRQAYKL